MKLFFGGNFPMMANPKKEKETKEIVEGKKKTYRRLISFYHLDKSQIILDMKKEESNASIKKS